VAGKVFRIGHLGSLNEVMVLGALSAAELTLLDCGVKIEPGSGVGAAIDKLRSAATTPTAQAA
jgi:alanine-glyoxylate transaminase/serine-glyoxylate transaminase/serine-pyruvate transaminase